MKEETKSLIPFRIGEVEGGKKAALQRSITAVSGAVLRRQKSYKDKL